MKHLLSTFAWLWLNSKGKNFKYAGGTKAATMLKSMCTGSYIDFQVFQCFNWRPSPDILDFSSYHSSSMDLNFGRHQTILPSRTSTDFEAKVNPSGTEWWHTSVFLFHESYIQETSWKVRHGKSLAHSSNSPLNLAHWLASFKPHIVSEHQLLFRRMSPVTSDPR